MREIKLNLKEKTKSKHKKEVNYLKKIFVDKNVNSFFQIDMKVSDIVKKEFESHFNPQNYSKESAGYFEAWPVMTLLLHSMEIGYRLGKNPKGLEHKRKKLSEVMKKYESLKFAPVKGYRDFNLFFIDKFVWEKKKAYYIDILGNQLYFNAKRFNYNLMVKKIKAWESKYLKTHIID